MPNDRIDWRADIRSRVARARLHPQDEADIVEEVAQHLEAQFDDLAPRIGAGPGFSDDRPDRASHPTRRTAERG